MTGIRGIAALAVVLYHSYLTWTPSIPELKIIEPFASHGNLGVDLFFLLSGFILSYVYCSKGEQLGMRAYGRFVWNRFGRIYPNHFVTVALLAVAVILSHMFHRNVPYENYPWNNLPSQLTLTHTWWPEPEISRWNFPSWSVSAEWFAYLFVFPLCAMVLRKKWSGGVFLAAGMFVLAVYFVSLPYIVTLPFARPYALPCVSAEFITGSLLFAAYRQRTWVVNWAQHNATWLFVAIICLVQFLNVIPGWIVVCLFPVLMLGLTSEESRIAKLLSSKLFLWLGKISYAIYMSHVFSFQIIRVFAPPERHAGMLSSARVFLLLVNLIIVIALGAGLYYLVEVPSRNYLRRVGFWRKKEAMTIPVFTRKRGEETGKMG